MFSNVSMTGTGLIILVLNLALQVLGHFDVHINVLPDQLSAFVDSCAQIVSFALMIWGQLRRPDLKMGLVRR
jgi:hypothetical protein